MLPKILLFRNSQNRYVTICSYSLSTKWNHQFCYICEIVGGDSFSAGSLKRIYFYAIRFLFVLQKKSENKLWIGTRAYYFLFNAFFSQVNKKRFIYCWVLSLINNECNFLAIYRVSINKSSLVQLPCSNKLFILTSL